MRQNFVSVLHHRASGGRTRRCGLGLAGPHGSRVAATHDAAGVAIAGRAFVAGGGTTASVPAVQVFPLGSASWPGGRAAVARQLVRARSDSAGVSAGAVGYVVGGYDGTAADPRVLAPTEGRHFRLVAAGPE